MEVKKIRTKEEFDAAVESNKAVCMKLYGIWCGPCKVLSTTLESMDNIEGLSVYEIDVDDCDEEIINSLSVRGVPTMILYKDGFQVDRINGAMGKEVIETKFKELVG